MNRAAIINVCIFSFIISMDFIVYLFRSIFVHLLKNGEALKCRLPKNMEQNCKKKLFYRSNKKKLPNIQSIFLSNGHTVRTVFSNDDLLLFWHEIAVLRKCVLCMRSSGKNCYRNELYGNWTIDAYIYRVQRRILLLLCCLKIGCLFIANHFKPFERISSKDALHPKIVVAFQPAVI